MPTGLTEGERTALADETGSAEGEILAVGRTSRSPYLYMLCGSGAFAVMASLTHGLGTKCDWQIIALVRSSLAFLFAATLTRAAGARFVFRSPPILWVRSLFGSISLVCTFYALSRPSIPPSEVLTLTNIFPLWVALLCWPLYGRRPTASLMLALGCGLAGVVLVQQPRFAKGDLGAVVALTASMATAVAMLGLNRLNSLDPRAIVVHFSGVSALACVACLLLFPLNFGAALPGGSALPMLVGVGASATVGQLCLTKAFAAGPPARVALVGLTQIPLAMLLDVAVWGHAFNGTTLLGTALVLGPTAWVVAGRQEAAGHG
jgi:drug/metabolite transporter (DMT)-like permease